MKIKTVTLLVGIFLFLACSTDDDSSAAQVTSVIYNETIINTTFFQEGSSAPTVNWNGNQGSFSLAGTIQGVSINTTTGVLSWSKLLAPKTHVVQVIATNSEGQTTITITLKNPLQGVFTKINNPTESIEIEFNTDNTMVMRTIDTSITGTTDARSGTYTINDNTILVDFMDNSGFSLIGPLTQSTSVATYSIDLIYSGTVAASFEVTMN